MDMNNTATQTIYIYQLKCFFVPTAKVVRYLNLYFPFSIEIEECGEIEWMDVSFRLHFIR